MDVDTRSQNVGFDFNFKGDVFRCDSICRIAHVCLSHFLRHFLRVIEFLLVTWEHGHTDQSEDMVTNQKTWWPFRGHDVTFDRIYWSFWSCFNYMKKQMLCLWAYTWLMPIWKSSLFLSGSPCLLLYLFVFYLLLKYFQCLSSLPLYQYCPQNPPPLQILTLLPLKTICDQPKCILLDLACFQGTWKSTPSSRRWQYNLSELFEQTVLWPLTSNVIVIGLQDYTDCHL